jgi:hypothetical protein
LDTYYVTNNNPKNRERGEAPCADYEDYKITMEQLNRLGLSDGDIEQFLGRKVEEEDIDEGIDMTSVDMLQLLLLFIKMYNPTFSYEVVAEKQMPTFSFYGFDKKQRHIGFIGYGLFSS